MGKISKCPICGHVDDWCNELVGQNGKLFGCHRIFDLNIGDKILGANNTTYVLISKKNNVGVFEEETQLLEARKNYNSQNIQKNSPNNKNRVEIPYNYSNANKKRNLSDFENNINLDLKKKIDEIYRYFLSLQNELDEDARQYFLDNNWTENLINNCGYKSAKFSSEDIEEICEKITQKFGKIKNIPGFFYEKDKLKYKLLPSILIPNINLDGLITSITIKPLDTKNGMIPKYYFFSSKNKKDGRGAVNEVSCVVNEKEFSKIFLTEGQKKAYIFESLFKIPSFSINGITSYNKFFDKDFIKYITENKVKDIIIGYDSDYKTNMLVEEALVKTAKKFEKIGLNVYILDWDTKYKGIDDLLLAGKEPRALRVENIK